MMMRTVLLTTATLISLVRVSPSEPSACEELDPQLGALLPVPARRLVQLGASFTGKSDRLAVDTFVVGKLMGHKDSKMIERYYGHLAPKNKSEDYCTVMFAV